MGKAEILQRIKDAEAKVRAMTQDAEDKRKQLQAEGKRKSVEMTEAAEADLRRRSDSEIALAKKGIERRKAAIIEDGRKKAGALASSAGQRMSSAKEFVLSEFERAVDA